jgi:hypothetical protein
MVGGWGTKKKKKKVSIMNIKLAKHCFYLNDCVQLHQCSPSCVYVQFVEPPSRKSFRLAASQEGPSSHVPPEPDPVTVPPSPTPPPSYIASTPSIAPLQSLQQNYVLKDYMFEGRESSLEGDSSDDEEEENMQDADIKNVMGWPPELLLVPHGERRVRKKYRAAGPHANNERGGRDVIVREAGGWVEKRLSEGTSDEGSGDVGREAS